MTAARRLAAIIAANIAEYSPSSPLTKRTRRSPKSPSRAVNCKLVPATPRPDHSVPRRYCVSRSGLAKEPPPQIPACLRTSRGQLNEC